MGGRPTELHHPDFNPDLNPYVGRMANRLVRSFAADFPGKDEDRWALITEILGFAAEAEQQLSEQRNRISQLESMALSDPLTGVGNRRSLEDFLRRAIANANRHGETGVVAFLDVDDFKAINDCHGHAVGDECLRRVAALLVNNTRISDFVARTGGDEFVVVLTHCSNRDGQRRMADLRHHLDQSIVHHEGADIALKASMGTACYDKGARASGLLETADSAMYKDKLTRKTKRNKAKPQRITG